MVGGSENCFRMGFSMRRLLGRATRCPWSAGRKTLFVWIFAMRRQLGRATRRRWSLGWKTVSFGFDRHLTVASQSPHSRVTVASQSRHGKLHKIMVFMIPIRRIYSIIILFLLNIKKTILMRYFP